MTYITRSYEETENLGYEFARTLKFKGLPIVIKLFGDLGSGKTTFVRGFLKFFNIYDVRSPSFTIINEYKVEDLVIYHIDFYRLSANEIEKLGIDELLTRKAILIVEWPSNANLEFENEINIYFEIISESERKIKIGEF